MSVDDQTPRAVSGNPVDGPRAERRPVAGVAAVAIVVLLAIGVAIAALDMKFEADQARWQQHQTCLDWYRLQAEYGLGPWYEKLPAAAADCGGGETDDGIPTVPGGSQPAIDEAAIPTAASITTTTIAPVEPFGP